jgi:hypothetical protein
MLRNTTGFAIRNVGATNCIQQGRLAVVDMTHDGNNWWTSDQGHTN